jgi:hypothetical protein
MCGRQPRARGCTRLDEVRFNSLWFGGQPSLFGQHVEQRRERMVATAFLSCFRCTSISEWNGCHDMCIRCYAGRDVGGVVFGETGVEIETVVE